jgi:hypothetical protein
MRGWPTGYKLATDFVRIADAPTADSVVLQAAGNHSCVPRPTCRYAIALPVFEDTALRSEWVDALREYDAVVAASTWNQHILTEAGLVGVERVMQGVDDRLPWRVMPMDENTFHGHGRGIFGGRRAIFSGGKLEFRKGQDIVLAAFRDHLKDDPDAILVTAWQNIWPNTLKGIDAMGYVKGWPSTRSDGSLDIVGWAVKNGVPARNIVDVGLVSNEALPYIVNECDVAVFPNRCEGGTNLAAMETIAANILTWATLGTGQRDLANVGDVQSIPFVPVTAHCSLYGATHGWTESTPAHVAHAMAQKAAPLLDPTVPSWSDYTNALLSLIPE